MPLRVLHLTSTRYGIGGVESLLLAAADKYDTGQFSVAYCNLFCDSDGDGRYPSALKERNLPFFHVPGRSWSALPGLLAHLTRLLRRERFDVLHMHMLQATLVGQVAARMARVPTTIITRHYTDDVYTAKGPLIRS